MKLLINYVNPHIPILLFKVSVLRAKLKLAAKRANVELAPPGENVP